MVYHVNGFVFHGSFGIWYIGRYPFLQLLLFHGVHFFSFFFQSNNSIPYADAHAMAMLSVLVRVCRSFSNFKFPVSIRIIHFINIRNDFRCSLFTFDSIKFFFFKSFRMIGLWRAFSILIENNPHFSCAMCSEMLSSDIFECRYYSMEWEFGFNRICETNMHMNWIFIKRCLNNCC